MSKFTVKITNDDTQSKKVLVFLKPPQPQREYLTQAWGIIGSAGPTGPLNYEALIKTAVTTQDEWPGRALIPGQLAIAPGTPLPPGTPTPAAPYCQLDRHWYVDGHSLPDMPRIDSPLAVGHEYQPSFSFTLTTPPAAEPCAASATDTTPPDSAER